MSPSPESATLVTEFAFPYLSRPGQLFPLLDERVDPQRVARVAVVDHELKRSAAQPQVGGELTAGGVNRAQLPIAERRLRRRGS